MKSYRKFSGVSNHSAAKHSRITGRAGWRQRTRLLERRHIIAALKLGGCGVWIGRGGAK